MHLTQKKCIPCEGNTPKLTIKQSNILLKQIPTWEIKNNRVFKKFKFKNFLEAMGFVNKIAGVAESEGHHPDIMIHYSQVNIELWTHAINGLSENDFIVAAKIDQIKK